MALKLVEPTNERSSNGGVIWRCKCSCGNLSRHEGHRVRKGQIKSCGCSRRTKDPQKSGLNMMYQIYKHNASRRNLNFDLSFYQFRKLAESNCHYCGRYPREARKKGILFVSNGVDRKNNDIGYIKTNCVSCCSTCNTAKMKMPYNEFISWIQDLVEYRSLEKIDIEYKDTISMKGE